MPLTIGGGSLFVTGAVGVLTTSLLLPGERRELHSLCAEFAGDECSAAAADRRDRAQSAADRIETLEGLRWVALSAAGLGLLGGAVGLASLLERTSADAAHSTTLHVSAGDFWIEWRGQF